MSLAASNATNSGLMLGIPHPHILIRPRPLERVGVQPVVLRPGMSHMLDELRPAAPRSPFEVAAAERIEQQLRLIQPRGMDRGEPTPPPAAAPGQVVRRRRSGMAGVTIVDQVHSPQVAMPTPETLQLLDI